MPYIALSHYQLIRIAQVIVFLSKLEHKSYGYVCKQLFSVFFFSDPSISYLPTTLKRMQKRKTKIKKKFTTFQRPTNSAKTVLTLCIGLWIKSKVSLNSRTWVLSWQQIVGFYLLCSQLQYDRRPDMSNGTKCSPCSVLYRQTEVP